MRPFTRLTGIAAPLLRDNIDTDAIIPSREMTSVSRQGLADGLFAGWRYRAIGSRELDPAFVLNRPAFNGAQIIVAGANFGCGSSREHAVWALAEYGIRAIVAPSFNPIFAGNCIANGLLPAVLPGEATADVAAVLEASETPQLTVDLETQTLSAEGYRRWHFTVDPEMRARLIAGLDAIGLTLRFAADIAFFRTEDAKVRPWVYFA